MADEEDSEAAVRFCPYCGSEAESNTSNCEECWRPLPLGGGTPARRTIDGMLERELPGVTLKGDPVPEPIPREPTGIRRSAGEQVPGSEPRAPAERKRGKITILIAVVVALVLIGGGLIAQSAIKGTPANESQSYKDGYSWGQDYGNGGSSINDLESVSTTCSLAWGVYNGIPGRGIPSSDNEEQWTQGCLAGLNAALK